MSGFSVKLIPVQTKTQESDSNNYSTEAGYLEMHKSREFNAK